MITDVGIVIKLNNYWTKGSFHLRATKLDYGVDIVYMRNTILYMAIYFCIFILVVIGAIIKIFRGGWFYNIYK